LVQAGISVRDGRGEEIRLPAPPQRIVSLVPSTTETVFGLGCGERLVGITRFCVHPFNELQGIERVGGTKDVDIDQVLALEPDLVLGNCEENTREMFEALEKHVPVYAAFPRTVDDAMEDVSTVGHLLGADEAALRWRMEAEAAREALRQEAGEHPWFRFAYLIWRQPWMTVNNDTFIASLLAEAGGQNAFGGEQDRFGEVTADVLGRAEVNWVFLSSEPFPFRDKHARELAGESGIPLDQFRYVDGEYCSWHGVRLAESFRYLARCLREGWPTRPQE
jgi:iron complex transport system substrate-binding protein